MNHPRPFRRATFDGLEPRCCLSSVGWDGPGLGGAQLQYFVGDIPASMDADQVRRTLEDALQVWSDVVDVEFTETALPGQRDSIDFQFARLDGAGGTLAQAYLPDDVNPARIAGDITFDTSERWETGNALGSSAFDLMLVAVHEIGHALGLDHSHVRGSVMNDTASPIQAFAQLATADIDAALALYAPADVNSPPADVTPAATGVVPDTTPVAEPDEPTIPETDPTAERPTTPRPHPWWFDAFRRATELFRPWYQPWSRFAFPGRGTPFSGGWQLDIWIIWRR